MGKTRQGKGRKLMAVADGSGLSLSVPTASARPDEVTLVQETLSSTSTTRLSEWLLGDKADDGDPLLWRGTESRGSLLTESRPKTADP